ncbi:hypothetical protein ABPG72_019344 [Tetrahymena utriculariae]
MEDVLFPQSQMVLEGDEFFKKIWYEIDQAKTYVWMLTYAFNNSETANTTFLKMIEACKRGCNVVLFVDDLQNYANKQLLSEFEKYGGLFKSLNPTYRHMYKNVPSQEFFRRHHEKILVIDDYACIGSANIEDCYGGYKYGTHEFYDINYMSKNMNLSRFRNHICQTADLYGLQLNKYNQSNFETCQILEKLYPDSDYVDFQTLVRKNHQPNVKDCQNEVIKQINMAQDNIVMIQPYYYPMKEFDDILIKALKRGVKVELITSQNRDQPAYAKLSNKNLMKNLIEHGCKVYEITDRLLHMKTYMVDDKHFTVGSFNNDRWSWRVNNEMNLFIFNSEKESQKMQQIIDHVKAESVELEKSKKIPGIVRQFKSKFWELFLYLSETIMSKNKRLGDGPKYNLYDYRSFPDINIDYWQSFRNPDFKTNNPFRKYYKPFDEDSNSF